MRRAAPDQSETASAGVPTKKQVLRHLAEREVPVVLIGGLALRIYASPRTTRDMDLAIRSLDADRAIEAMYEVGFRLVASVTGGEATVLPLAGEALRWAETSGTRSMSFIPAPRESLSRRIPLGRIDPSAQVNFHYDLAVPVMRLAERAREVHLEGLRILVAAPEDLLALKQAIAEKTERDRADIAFLENLLRDRSGH